MKTYLATITSSILFVLVSCNQSATDQTDLTRGEAPALSQADLMKQAYREIVKAFETGNTDSLGKYVAENSIDHGTPPPGITSTGLQRFKDMIALYRTSFPDMRMTYHNLVADGDLLIAHGTWSGTNSGPFMNGPATNKPVSAEFVDIVRWENGKFAEHWEVSDNIAFFTQMGLMPPQGPAPASVQHNTYDWNATAATDPAKAVKMKEAYAAVLNLIQSGDLANLGNYMADDFKEHMQIPGTAFVAGIEGAKQAMTMLKQAYPDLKMTVEHVATEGDILIAHIWTEGTYSGSIPGFPPAAKGKTVKFAAVDIVKFNAEGKATNHWEVGDHYTELVQLGVIPSPGDAQASAQ